MKSIKAIIGDRETVVVDPLLPDCRRRSADGCAQYRRRASRGRRSPRGNLPNATCSRASSPLIGIRRSHLVGEVMSTDLIVAEVTETYEACLGRMQQTRVRHLIVLDKGGSLELSRCGSAGGRLRRKTGSDHAPERLRDYIPADVEEAEKLTCDL